MKNPRGIGIALAFLPGVACLAQPTPVLQPQSPLAQGDAPAPDPKGDLERPPTYGLQVYLARPEFDLRPMVPRTGQGVGLFMETSLTPTSVLQSRLDYVNYGQTDFTTPQTWPLVPPGVTSLTANAASLGADLRQYLPYPGLKRLYILAGMSAIRYEFRTLSTPPPTLDQNGLPLPTGPVATREKTSMKWGLAVGLGWEVLHGYALTTRYTYVPVSSTNLGGLEFGLRASF